MRLPCDVITPAIAVRRSVVERNCKRMLDRAKKLGVKLRPHVKTHKTIEGALLQTGGLRERITVSTLQGAKFFSDGGFDDIVYAVPIVASKLPAAEKLLARLRAFYIVVDNPDTFEAIVAYAKDRDFGARGLVWKVHLMVDCGYHRDGIDPNDEASFTLAQKINDDAFTSLCGIYTHGGHSYDSKTVEEVVEVAKAERDAVVDFARALHDRGILGEDNGSFVVGVGSTPTCSHPPDHLHGVHEMHPGNYAYYDAMQEEIGVCNAEDVAVRVITSVIGHYKNMILVDMVSLFAFCRTQPLSFFIIS